MVTCTFYPSSQKAEAEGPLGGQPGLQSKLEVSRDNRETLSQKLKQQKDVQLLLSPLCHFSDEDFEV